MSKMPAQKYRAYAPVGLDDRTWPSRTITRAPIWCSVDLRDGNQALPEPMGLERKTRMFRELVAMGFKEIEVGFPSASQPDFDFVRQLIDENMIPADVTIQVLTQARDHLIERTFESIRGARRVIVHVYNSTSTLQRRVVFGLDEAGIKDIAVRGTERIRELAKTIPETEVLLEYSPESFTGTELPFALEICDAVLAVWGATPQRKVILNLPATVEMSTPNIYADMIEWFHRHVSRRDSVVLSVHPHNDRGTGVAAAELAMMAGCDRVEGTLFGNGERTGNVDVVTLALNMFTQGVDPELEIHDIDALVRMVEHCNRLPVHPRHPYAGELVYTAFSGSHQDAIRKGFAALRSSATGLWEVPYLPIDPADLGRSYEAVIRVNSQSGKGGIGWVLETDHGLRLPRGMLVELSRIVQTITETTETEITPAAILSAFEREYLRDSGAFVLHDHRQTSATIGHGWEVALEHDGRQQVLHGVGNGPIDAFVHALASGLGLDIRVTDYAEHALGQGADAEAVAYVEIACEHGKSYGAARHTDIVRASIGAVVSALNRLAALRGATSLLAAAR